MIRRYVYDIAAGDQRRWNRLRDAGATVKEIAHDGRTEAEVVVGDFDTTNALLGWIGLDAKPYQENRRVSFELDGARLELDRWPLIPPHLEIEGDSNEHVVEWATARFQRGSFDW